MTLSASYWAADRSQPVLGLTVGDALRDAAAQAPDTTALVAGAVDPAARRRWSYAELLEASERAGRALLGRFAPGDRVAVWANNIPEWVILELAAGLAGITIVTVNPALRSQELTLLNLPKYPSSAAPPRSRRKSSPAASASSLTRPSAKHVLPVCPRDDGGEDV